MVDEKLLNRKSVEKQYTKMFDRLVKNDETNKALAESLDEILLMGRPDIARNVLASTKKNFNQYEIYMNKVRTYENTAKENFNNNYYT